MVKLPPISPGQRIGLFGGSFNPAHRGHVMVAQFALKRLQLDQVWWLVSPQNPLKDPGETGEYATRLAATRALASDPRFVVTDIEQQGHCHNTAETLQLLAPAMKQAHFVWIMGADSLKDFHRWHDWTLIAKTLPLAILARPGYSIRALRSKTALRFEHARVPAQDAKTLVTRKAPAWTFISMPLRAESSTAIRHHIKAVSL